MPKSTSLPDPHGGTLVDLMVAPREALALKTEAQRFPSWTLAPHQIADLELLLSGGLSPLRGYMTSAECGSVAADMRLPNGLLWPLQVTLDVTSKFAQGLDRGTRISLTDAEGTLLAVMTVADSWTDAPAAPRLEPDHGVTGEHPRVRALSDRTFPVQLGGPVQGIEMPMHYDFAGLRRTPAETRQLFSELGWTRVLAFEPHDPLDRPQIDATIHAAEQCRANILMHSGVGLAQADDSNHYFLIRSYERALSHFPCGQAELSLFPLASRGTGAREVLRRALVHLNFGCSHYAPHEDAGAALEPFLASLGIEILAPVPTAGSVELEKRLVRDEEIPQSLAFEDVAAELQRVFPPRRTQGLTVFFTGLSGAGKSSIAKALLAMLMEMGSRSVTLLDGDVVRRNLSSELGFSRRDRDLNILRIGYVASEITKHGGIAICAPIAPYAASRATVREAVSQVGGFVQVYVATPLDVCESRDRKGLYARARAGVIPGFTGISDPYEAPEDSELVLDTRDCSPQDAARVVVDWLTAERYIG